MTPVQTLINANLSKAHRDANAWHYECFPSLYPAPKRSLIGRILAFLHIG